MHRTARIPGALAALLAVLGQSGCVAARPALPAHLRSELQVELDRIRERGDLPGITAAVGLADGAIAGFASGYADAASRSPMRPHAVMPAGSVGKQFFAMVVLALAHENRVAIDAPISRLFEEDAWFERLPNARMLTLRLLLMHRSGIGDHRDSEGFRAVLRQHLSRQPYDPEFTVAPEELVSFVLDTPPSFAPGEGFRYSETGYILAGMAVERACSCIYYAELERRFLGPLGLTRTMPAISRSVAHLANGYIGPRLPGFPEWALQDGALAFSPATEWTGGGLYSNVTDLVRWSRTLHTGKLMSWPYLPEVLGQQGTPPPGEEGYGLGVRILSTPLGVAYGHAGEFPGYYTLVLYFAAHQAAVALQTNTFSSSAAFLSDAATSLMAIALGYRGTGAAAVAGPAEGAAQ